MAEILRFASDDAARLEAYLPPSPLSSSSQAPSHRRPFVTLTFATSLDSALSLAPGVRTALSGPQSKAMTHYLRSRHDAILVGVGTAVADDPGLNCRIASDASPSGVSAHQPRPIVIDPQNRWSLTHDSRVLETVRRGLGLAPFVMTAVHDLDAEKRLLLERHGGKYIILNAAESASSNDSGATSVRFRWEDILSGIAREGLNSVMIEGGGSIINTLLEPPNNALVHSVIVTIAPTWLGRGGVVVSPQRAAGNGSGAVTRLTSVKWYQLGEDVILCGLFNR